MLEKDARLPGEVERALIDSMPIKTLHLTNHFPGKLVEMAGKISFEMRRVASAYPKPAAFDHSLLPLNCSQARRIRPPQVSCFGSVSIQNRRCPQQARSFSQ